MTRKYRRMTVSFEVLMLAPGDNKLDEYFINYDDDKKPVHQSFTLTDDEHEDVLADMSLPQMRESTCRKFRSEMDLAQDMGDNGQIFAFLATLCERFFITDITIGRPVEYEEPTR